MNDPGHEVRASGSAVSFGDRLAAFVLSGFGSGYSKIAPGTCGTLAALAVVLLLSRTALPAQPTLLALAATATIGCLVWGGSVEKRFGAKDPGFVVLDEFAGFFVALALPGDAWPTAREWIAGFVLFRLFDIIKPPPARRLQSLRGGLGIVVDDLIAGGYALAGVYVVRDLAQNPW
jgi:phosphatidylglycerophosphatase A